ncbi:hypothetical protein [Pseudomonas sp. EMN2]|uniref:hypothetical protein n=1 Tax=Pseudomonas sp. EMN2 TaxID=2615212 RepID=UPI00129BED2A|nr:hypothetical protein [Pseudomonas sp. EMN2]
MKPRVLLPLVGLVVIVGLVLAALLREPLSPSEQHLERAVALIQQANVNVQALAEAEADGEAISTEQLMPMSELIDEARAHIELAAEAGNTLALFWQSNLQTSADRRDRARRQGSCARLHQAVAQGFLAAAVAYYYRCKPTTDSFDFMGAEQVALLEVLKAALQRDDPHQSLYPQFVREVHCFRPATDIASALPSVSLTVGEMLEKSRQVLSYDQFKAEALYLLATHPAIWQQTPMAERLAMLREAESLGCGRASDWRQRLEANAEQTPKGR